MKRRFVKMAQSRLPASPCPSCGKRIDGVTGFAGMKEGTPVPAPGKPTICLYCAAVLVFDSHMRVRRPTPELECRLLAENGDMAAFRDVWSAYLISGGKKPPV